MASTPMSTAQGEGYFYLLTIWPTVEHRRLGGDSIRAATGRLRGGDIVTVTDAAGVSHVYPPYLDPKIAPTELFSTAVDTISVTLPWDRDSIGPIDLDLSYAVGELARIDTASGGASVVAWEKRRVILSGPVSANRWGDKEQSITFTLSGTEPEDEGDWYEPGAEFSSDQFADMANEETRDRAHLAAGQCPPMVWAPVDSEIRVPAPVVVDEDDAVTGVSDLVYRRHFIGRRKPTNTTALEQFQMVDPAHPGSFLASTTSSVFKQIPVQGTDALGKPYWYVPGNFVLSFGSSSVTLAGPVPGPASDIMTATRTSRYVQEGFQVKGSTGGADDYLVAISRDGSTVELGNSSGTPVAYGGADVANGQGSSIPLPIAEMDGTCWLPKLGGISAPDNTPITQAVDTLIDWLQYAKLNMPVATGDLLALRARFEGLDLSYFRRERGKPYDKILGVLEYLPIRPFVSGGILRFGWTGPITEQDIVATVDLDDIGCGMKRLEPIQWSDEPTYPIIQMRYWYDLYTGSDGDFTRSFALDGSRLDYSEAQRQPVGRAIQAYEEWLSAKEIRDPDDCPRLSVEIDTIEKLVPRGLTILWLLYRWGHRRPTATVEIDGSWRDLEPGDCFRATQTDATYSDQIWRVEGITLDGQGAGRLLLDGVTT